MRLLPDRSSDVILPSTQVTPYHELVVHGEASDAPHPERIVQVGPPVALKKSIRTSKCDAQPHMGPAEARMILLDRRRASRHNNNMAGKNRKLPVDHQLQRIHWGGSFLRLTFLLSGKKVNVFPLLLRPLVGFLEFIYVVFFFFFF